MYLGLFGRTLATGETAIARSRLAVLSGATDEAIVNEYRVYLETLQKESKP